MSVASSSRFGNSGGGQSAPGVVFDQNVYGLNYAELIAPTVMAVKEVDRGQQDLNAQVIVQGRRLDVLEAENENLKEENELIKAELCMKDSSYSFCG